MQACGMFAVLKPFILQDPAEAAASAHEVFLMQ
jgi:hypothetical protein